MGAKPRLVVVGNCQAWALTALMKSLLPGVEVEKPVAVHLLKPAHEEEVSGRLAGADLILSQLVNDSFPLPFVRTDTLKESFGAKVTTWLNLYYRGQNPELCYKRELAGKTLFPLGDYHIETVYDAYVEGASVDEAVERLSDPTWNEDRYGTVPKQSLEELQAREALVDAPISDQIALREEFEPLFFTFNHPSLQILADYALRLTQAMGFEPSVRMSVGMLSEPLARIVVPGNPMTRRGKQIQDLPGPRTYRGLEAADDADAPPPFVTAVMTEHEVVERFYAAYRSVDLAVAA